MGKIDLLMPKMGESIMEATILKWLKKVGDRVEVDESILEIATDKVDSDIPSPVNGVIAEILFEENETIEVGKVIARITTSAEAAVVPSPAIDDAPPVQDEPVKSSAHSNNGHDMVQSTSEPQVVSKAQASYSSKPLVVNKEDYRPSQTNRFYSPLVRTIAKQESISVQELDNIPGTGAKGRVTKNDILSYVSNRGTAPQPIAASKEPVINQVIKEEVSKIEPSEIIELPPSSEVQTKVPETSGIISGRTEIIEMDRMRKLIANHMTKSKQTSAHVTSFVEVDVTNIVQWRERIKDDFQKSYGEKITFTPIFLEAVNKAIKDYPMINCSLDGDKIIKKNYVNLGMAAALPSGNLIVPVIKNADHLNLLGLTKAVNDLAARARSNSLKADEIADGTFTVTNVGTFGNVMGTPIINQPQVAILAVGAIKKKPAVVETEMGDLIAIRHMMFLSLSYDHRIVDGFLGGSFLRKIADYLEAFDKNRNI
jgi:2-oxoglutarate dehydrogenase E2 component (dihydrolipoamide succinyltransferase)